MSVNGRAIAASQDVQTAVLSANSSALTSSFATFTPADLVLTAAASGRYLITLVARGYTNRGLGADATTVTRITKNGTAIANTEVVCSMVSDTVTGDGWATGTTAVYATLVASDIIRVEAKITGSVSFSGQITTDVNGATWLSIAHVP